MASRSFNRKQALEKEIKEIYAKITFGATGAPTLTTGHGVASITRTTNGDYALTLQDAYNSLKMAEGTFLDSSGEDIRIQLKSETVSSTKIINFFTLTGATPTDPSNGAVLFLKFELKNTSVV